MLFRSFTTSAMQHGLYSEPDAFHNVIQPVYPNAVYQSDVSILIKDCGANSLVWATPDVVDDVEGITFDIKCPEIINVEEIVRGNLPGNKLDAQGGAPAIAKETVLIVPQASKQSLPMSELLTSQQPL